MPADIVSFIKRDYIHSMAKQGVRLDGRGMEELREIVVTKPFVTSAEGSARVKLGKTDVVVGVKIEPGTPFADRPNQGVLIANAELVPIASPDFEPGPPRPPAIELARVTDRAIREAQTFDLAPLCIEPGKKVFMVFIDIHPVDYHGNLFDSCEWGALAALSVATVPWSKIDPDRKDERLKIQNLPVSITVAKLGDRLMVDPSLDEEEVADTRLTVCTDQNGDVRAMQKGLAGSFTVDEIKYIVELSRTLGKKVRSKLAD